MTRRHDDSERLEQPTEDLDFDLLFDDECSGGCEDRCRHDTYTCMNKRVLQRLLTTSSDSLSQQVRARHAPAYAAKGRANTNASGRAASAMRDRCGGVSD